MELKTFLQPLFFFLAIQTSVIGQQTVPVGQIQQGVPILLTSTAQFNAAMADFFPDRSYSNLQLLSGNDAKGSFYYLKVDALSSSGAWEATIVLEQAGSELIFSSVSGCEMKCERFGSCKECDLTIIERCKSLSSQCTKVRNPKRSGGASVVVTFPEE